MKEGAMLGVIAVAIDMVVVVVEIEEQWVGSRAVTVVGMDIHVDVKGDEESGKEGGMEADESLGDGRVRNSIWLLSRKVNKDGFKTERFS